MKKLTKSMLMTAVILGAVAAQGNAYAAGPEFVLDEMVVTASRMETKLLETPANVTIIDADKLASRHYQNVAEALKDVPGALVMDTGVASFEKNIILNGDERVLVLVDGRRVNFDMGSMTRSGYDLNQLPDVGLIERIEVVKGASGALYGSDAVGGVVNIITKKADHSYGKIAAGAGSFGTREYKALYSGKENKTGFTIDAARNEQDYAKYHDVLSKTDKRWPGRSDFEQNKVSLNLVQELTEDTSLEVGYDYSKFEGTNPNKVNLGYPAEIDKETQNIHTKYAWNLANGDAGYLQYYHNKLEYENLGGMEEKANLLDLQQEFTLSANNKLVAGASWRDSEVTNDVYYAEGGKIHNLSLFVSDKWNITEDLSLDAGVRYDDHNKAGDDTTWSLGLNKIIDDNSHIYANWGQVFKAPTADDLFYYAPGGVSEYGPYGAMLGNPNLKPETGENWAIGYGAQLSEQTNINISYFKSDLEDAIAWETVAGSNDPDNPYDDDYAVKNINEQKKEGMELTINHRVNDNVDLEASYTYLKVRNNEHKAGFKRDFNAIPNTYRLGVHYQDGQWDSSLTMRAGNGASSAKFVDSSYITFDLAVNFQQNDHLSFYAKAYNLADESYSERGGVTNGSSYDYPAMSRHFILGAEYTF